MTHRGRLALVLGAATYLAAWAFGSKILYPVALGLPLAVLLGTPLGVLLYTIGPNGLKHRPKLHRVLDGWMAARSS